MISQHDIQSPINSSVLTYDEYMKLINKINFSDTVYKFIIVNYSNSLEYDNDIEVFPSKHGKDILSKKSRIEMFNV